VYDVREYEQPDWQPSTGQLPQNEIPVPVKRPNGWLGAGIAFVGTLAVAAVVIGIVFAWVPGPSAGDTAGTLGASAAVTYRTSVTPDYVAFEHVYSSASGTDPMLAGTSFAVSVASTLANAACTQLQAGISEETLVARLGATDGLGTTNARTIINAAHNLVCNGR
jgi:hypothetical protein